jgi:CHASE3 domain sensor protein
VACSGTLDVVPGAPPDVAAVLTAYQQGQQNMLAVISMVTSTVTAQEAARTERYRIDSDARQREQALLFKEIRSVDRERAEHPPAVDADALARRISDDVREQLEDFEEEIDEKIAGAKPPPANATQETIASIGSALQAGLPVIEGVMSMVANRNGGGSPGGSSGNQPKTGE